MFKTGPILISRILAGWFRSMRGSSDIDILPSELFVGTKDAFFSICEPPVPLGDEFSVSQFVLQNPLGWCGAVLALGVMATVISSFRIGPKGIQDKTSTGLII